MAIRRGRSLLAWLSLTLPALAGTATTQPAAERIVVPLKAISAFEGSKEFERINIVRGQMESCTSQPAETARKLPPLKSAKPLYGQAEFNRRYLDAQPGIRFAFVIDESQGTGKGYDRLYFDLNQDGDLTNDKPVGIMQQPPEWKHYKSSEVTETIFDYIEVPFDYGPPTGRKPFQIMPMLNQWKEGENNLLFIATEARQGKFKLGGKRFHVLLSQPYSVSGRFDGPGTKMDLLRDGRNDSSGWWGRDSLRAVHTIDGRLYRFSATPTGDQFFVQPYEGDMGIVRAGAGGRKIDGVKMRGSLHGKDCAVAIGTIDEEDNWPEETAEASIPVGDYTASLLNFQMGKLRVEISNNYHADGEARALRREPVYGIRVRKDKPFVLDFSNKPAVLFACPAREQVLHPGEEINVKAVLIDPVLDVMIRELQDTTRKQKKYFGDDNKNFYESDLSLDPAVVITDAAGKRIAEGTMPFG